jgi:archaellum component FlaC
MNESEIVQHLKNISERLDKIENDILYLKKGSDNMSHHITFIESVYETVKKPFYFVMNRIQPIQNIPVKKALLEGI